MSAPLRERSRSPRTQQPQDAVAVGDRSSTKVVTMGGQTGWLDLGLLPPADFHLLRERVLQKGLSQDPHIVFTNRCRPVLCLDSKEGPACYFEGDSMQPIGLVDGCDAGDPTDAKLWFQNFLTASMGPMARILAHTNARAVYLTSAFLEIPMMSLGARPGNRAHLACLSDADGVHETAHLFRSLDGVGGDTWEGEPTPRMIRTMQKIMQGPLPVRTELIYMRSRAARGLPDKEGKLVGTGTIQLLVPQYVDKLRESDYGP
jgi:hypothetical protein